MITHHKEVFDIRSDEPVFLVKLQFLISRMELFNRMQDVPLTDNTFLNFQATYSPRRTNEFFVAEWIALGLTCRRGLCVLRVCLQLSNCTIHTKPRMIEDKFFLELLDPFMVADEFRPLPQGRRHAQQIDVVFVVSLHH